MDNSLSKEASDWREGRRLRAFELKQQEMVPAAHSRGPGCEQGSGISQWMKRARQGGGVQAL